MRGSNDHLVVPGQHFEHDSKTYLDSLRSMWGAKAARVLRDKGYIPFGKPLGKKRLSGRLHREVSYPRRIRGRVLAEGEPGAVLGSDTTAIAETVYKLARASQGLLVLPSRGNSSLMGRLSYAAANPPNPYQWCPVVSQHCKMGGIIWEMGPALSASAATVAKLLGRKLFLPQLPAPGSSLHRLQFIPGYPKAEDVPPDLVLVPLPLPCDLFSVGQHVALAQRYPTGIWRWAADMAPELQHPEFCIDLDSYLAATSARLKTIDLLVQEHGAHVCTSAPMVLGLPRVLERTIRRALGWKVIARYTAVEKDGARHVWNGSPLVGEALVVWGAS